VFASVHAVVNVNRDILVFVHHRVTPALLVEVNPVVPQIMKGDYMIAGRLVCFAKQYAPPATERNSRTGHF
jgi:hypothetical protein